jgi:surface antigen
MTLLNPCARSASWLVAATVLALASGCTKQNVGTAVGGALGGLLGAQVGDGAGQLAATAAGALAGSLIGGSIGSSMDELDQIKSTRALETAPTGQPTSWQNPDSGGSYTVTPTRTWQTAEGPCREYTTDAVVGGRNERVYGTACRQPDGQWQAVN